MSSAPFPLPRPPLAISVCILPHSIGCRVHVHSDHRRPLSVPVFSAPPGCRVQEHSGQRGASVLPKKIRTYIDVPMHACLCGHAGIYSPAHITSTLCHIHTYILTASWRSCGLTAWLIACGSCFPLTLVWELPTAPAALHSCSGLQYRFCVAQYIAGCLFMSIYTILEDRVLQGAPPHSYDGARCAERAPCPKTLMWLGL